VSGAIDTVTQHFPAPVAIQHRGHALVVLDYEEWKRRILRLQGGDV
jgi:hypothetical protein